MRDFTLRFSDKADFRAFLRKLNWEEDEELQNAVLVDEIGFTFRETDVSDDGEPEYTKRRGTLLISVFLTMDLMIPCSVSGWLPEHPLRGWFKDSRWISRRYFMRFVPWRCRYWLVFLPENFGAIAGCTFFIAREHTQGRISLD